MKDKGRPLNSKLIGSLVFSVYALVLGINNLAINKAGYLVLIWFTISGISLIYYIYQSKYFKKKPGEMYDDERMQFISEKSSSISFSMLLVVILILQFLIQRKYIVVESSSLLSIILGIALIINSVTFLIYKSKY